MKIDLRFLYYSLGLIFTITVAGFMRLNIFHDEARVLNPDEAEILAMAKSVKLSELGQGYTTSTYGPLLPYLISLALKAGLPSTLGGMHLLQFIFSSTWLIVCLYLVFRLRGRETPLAEFTLFASVGAIAIVFPSKIDFLTFCSETLPITLILIGIRLLFSDLRFSTLYAGITASLVFFTKSQLLPLAISIFVLLIIFSPVKDFRHERSNMKRRLVLFSGGLSLASVLILLILVINDAFIAWLNQSFLFSILYTSSELGAGLGGGKSLFDKTLGAARLVVSDPILSSLSLVLLISLFSIVYIEVSRHKSAEKLQKAKSRRLKRSPKKNNEFFKTENLLMPVALLFVNAVAFLSVAVTGNLFPHYLLILYFANIFTFLFLAAWYCHQERETPFKKLSRGRKSFGIYSVLLIVLLNFQFDRQESFSDTMFTLENGRLTPGDKLVLETLKDKCPSNSKVLIWGWASEYFGYADWVPVPNFINDASRIVIYNDEFSRKRFFELIEEATPDCILSATGSSFPYTFFGEEPNLIQFLPSIERIILKNYRLAEIPSNSGLLWIRIP